MEDCHQPNAPEYISDSQDPADILKIIEENLSPLQEFGIMKIKMPENTELIDTNKLICVKKNQAFDFMTQTITKGKTKGAFNISTERPSKLMNTTKWLSQGNRESECEFWQLLESGEITVQYGADLRVPEFHNMKKPFGLTPTNLLHSEKLFDQNNEALQGIRDEFMYLGSPNTVFGLHNEDLGAYGFNIIHQGKKMWYTICPSSETKFLNLCERLCPDQKEVCKGFMRHKTLLISPELLAEEDIKFTETLQKKGDIIVVNCGAYHSGYNIDYNIATAANFLIKPYFSTLEFLKASALRCMCVESKETKHYDIFRDFKDENMSEIIKMMNFPKHVEKRHIIMSEMFQLLHELKMKNVMLELFENNFPKMTETLNESKMKDLDVWGKNPPKLIHVQDIGSFLIETLKKIEEMDSTFSFCEKKLKLFIESLFEERVNSQEKKIQSPFFPKYLNFENGFMGPKEILKLDFSEALTDIPKLIELNGAYFIVKDSRQSQDKIIDNINGAQLGKQDPIKRSSIPLLMYPDGRTVVTAKKDAKISLDTRNKRAYFLKEPNVDLEDSDPKYEEVIMGKTSTYEYTNSEDNTSTVCKILTFIKAKNEKLVNCNVFQYRSKTMKKCICVCVCDARRGESLKK